MHRVSGLLSLLCVGACATAAPEGDIPAPASAPLIVEQVAGCYRVRNANGSPLDGPGTFWGEPFRLDLVPLRHLGPIPMRAPYADRSVVSLAPASEALTRDTTRSSFGWRLESPDTLRITRSTGFEGTWFRFGRDGDRWTGTRQWFSDVVIAGKENPRYPVILERVGCPSG